MHCLTKFPSIASLHICLFTNKRLLILLAGICPLHILQLTQEDGKTKQHLAVETTSSRRVSLDTTQRPPTPVNSAVTSSDKPVEPATGGSVRSSVSANVLRFFKWGSTSSMDSRCVDESPPPHYYVAHFLLTALRINEKPQQLHTILIALRINEKPQQLHTILIALRINEKPQQIHIIMLNNRTVYLYHSYSHFHSGVYAHQQHYCIETNNVTNCVTSR